MDNLRKIEIRGNFCDSYVFLKYSEFRDGEDFWEKIGSTYCRKGAYDLVRMNPKGFEFVCDEKVEAGFRDEKYNRESLKANHARASKLETVE